VARASGRCAIFYEPPDDGIDVVLVSHAARHVNAQFGTDSAKPLRLDDAWRCVHRRRQFRIGGDRPILSGPTKTS